MSPASQGALEVERYIGSCLISSNLRAGLHGKPVPVCRKQQEQAATGRGGKARNGYNGGQNYSGLADQQQGQVQYGGPGGWTGAPLISMTSSPRRCNQRLSPSLSQQQQQQQQTCGDQQQVSSPGSHPHKNPLSRLAIHTQGAPLILTGRLYNRGKVHSNNSGNNSGGSNGNVNTSTCNNVAGNYAHSTANSFMTNNANAATRCPASRIPSQRPAEVTAKKPPTIVSSNSKATATNGDCSSSTSKENSGTSNIANIDSLSIASDESSGSNNSENSLPRIIKPRKRRKKDRKPPNNVIASGVDAIKPEEPQVQRQQLAGCVTAAGEQSNLAGVKSYVPTCYEPRIYEAAAPHLRNYRRPPIGHRENTYGGCRAPSMQIEIADVRPQRYVHHRHHVQVKVLDDNRNVIAAPIHATAPPKNYRHHHANDHCSGNLPRRYVHEYPAESCEDAGRRDRLGPCQCRYCDPAGLIWDVDRNGYSPFLTTNMSAPPGPPPPPPPPPPASSGVEYCRANHFGQIPLFLASTCTSLEERALDRVFDEHSRPHDDRRDARPSAGSAGVMLRRSWSDPTSYFSYAEEISAPARDVGVIGDRGGQFESGRHKRTLWRGDSIGSAPLSLPANANAANLTAASAVSPKGLEVSTEIITSPNGHRDLEIKFYSSPSPAERLAEEDKSSSSFTGEADDDDNEDDDFSDIWSYHELKLQQDFRTLLQAEE
ncbi:hypothetical protein PUN28_006621 [Cardiocondyla obscurior]|uniref:Uncharacterized protein n=1 Tax=Cardiocondyla obscurior TaxID=286306 RepID=A0AAW2GE98_9HYME